MNCIRCNDTGSLTKELWGDLDCVRCSAAVERVALSDWLRQRRRAGDISEVDHIDAWLIYQHGKASAATPP